MTVSLTAKVETASRTSVTLMRYRVYVPATGEAVVSYDPEVALETTIAKASYADQFILSIEDACWRTYCLMALVPGTVPLHERVTMFTSYMAGVAVKDVGGIGSVFLRTMLPDTVQSE